MDITEYLWRPYNGHVLIIAFLIGLFGMVLIGVQQSLSRAEASVKDSLAVVAFLQSSVSDKDAAALTQALKSQDAELMSVDYMSKDQAYALAMKDPNLSKSLQLLKANPLPASLTLHYSERAQWERIEPGEKLKGQNGIQDVRWDPQAYALYRSVHRWRLWAMRFSAFVVMTLIVWAFIGLYRFLSLNAGSREIGATLAVGWAGGALAWGLWGLGLHTIQAEISGLRPVWVWVLPMVMGIIAALGCFGLEVRNAE